MKFLSTLLVLFSFNLAFAGEIILGQSVALNGPTKFLGTEMHKGAKTYFEGTNVKLLVADDKYSPLKCTLNTGDFIKKNVTALFGYVGTPTAKAAVPLAMEAKKIFFGAFTGAGFLSDAHKNPYAFSVRASYCQETDKMVDSLVAKGIKKIAIFRQDDSFGNVGKSCVDSSLARHELKIVGEGRYKRNTVMISKGASRIVESGAEAVILIGSYKPCGAAILFWKKKGFNVPCINISFVGSKELIKNLKGQYDNVYVTQVVPNPWDSSIPIVKEYHEKIGSEFGFISLEGYITAKIFHKALISAGEDANNSDKLKTLIEGLGTYDIGGLSVSFGTDDHRGLSEVYLTKINKDGSFKYVNEL